MNLGQLISAGLHLQKTTVSRTGLHIYAELLLRTYKSIWLLHINPHAAALNFNETRPELDCAPHKMMGKLT
jgi:hypothetical protein